jgi:hypothetical protein
VGATEKTKVLILVKTYPLPSRGHQEVVCTAGITESGEWVRLYPIDYRYRPRDQQFEEYQWIEVELEPKGSKNDKRRESRRPVLESIRRIGEPLSTKRKWAARRQIVDRLPHYTMLNESVRLGSDAAAAESVKKKFFDELCRADKDTRFFMGTCFPYNTWLVLGVFWPPKDQQQTLF